MPSSYTCPTRRSAWRIGPCRWDDLIAALQASREILEDAARQHGGLISVMATIQEQLARIDFNLSMAYGSDVPRYHQPMARPSPRHSRSATSWRSSGRSPTISDGLRNGQLPDGRYQVEDGREPDLALYDRPSGSGTASPPHPGNVLFRAGLVFVRIELADELATRGRIEEARAFRDRSLTSVRGNVEVLFQIALNYAENVRLIGTYPMKLDVRRQQDRRRKLAHRAFRCSARRSPTGSGTSRAPRQPASPVPRRPGFQGSPRRSTCWLSRRTLCKAVMN